MSSAISAEKRKVRTGYPQQHEKKEDISNSYEKRNFFLWITRSL